METSKRFVDVSIENLMSLASPEWDPMYIEEDEITDTRLIDSEKTKKDGLIAWRPIDSLISDNEILEVESELKFPLPASFKWYLKYKNFHELDVLSNVLLFRPLIPEIWKKKILDSTFNGYPKEFIYDKGLIPFADFSDWGLTCFNTNKSSGGNEYEIVIWDHERPTETEYKADNFEKMLKDILDNYDENKDGVLMIS